MEESHVEQADIATTVDRRAARLWGARDGGLRRQPPLANLSQAELAVQEADTKTASQYAPLELKTAREQLAEAKRAMDDEEYDEARRLVDQALANAQLAEAKAGAEKARLAAAELQ